MSGKLYNEKQYLKYLQYCFINEYCFTIGSKFCLQNVVDYREKIESFLNLEPEDCHKTFRSNMLPNKDAIKIFTDSANTRIGSSENRYAKTKQLEGQ